MQKKEFELIASALRKANVYIREAKYENGRDAWATTVETMASFLDRTNPRFNRKRFLLACCDTVADRNSLLELRS